MVDFDAVVEEAIRAPLEVVPVTFDELLAEWHGDDDSLGFHSEEIVAKVCELQSPAGPAGAVALFYPGVFVGEVEEEDRDMIQRGYDLYMRRLSLPRRRSGGVVSRVNQALGR